MSRCWGVRRTPRPQREEQPDSHTKLRLSAFTVSWEQPSGDFVSRHLRVAPECGLVGPQRSEVRVSSCRPPPATAPGNRRPQAEGHCLGAGTSLDPAVLTVVTSWHPKPPLTGSAR